MLRKEKLKKVMTGEGFERFYQHYQNLCAIKTNFKGLWDPGVRYGTFGMPGCHDAAHAYAKAFNCKAVDGRKFYIQENRTRWRGLSVKTVVEWYAHSWNVIEVGDNILILDLLPDETCSMLPIMLEHPNPAYQEEKEGRVADKISTYLATSEAQRRIELLTKEFKKLVTPA